MDLAIERLRTLRVADVMTRPVIPVSREWTLERAAAAFGEHKISAAPVVDGEGACVGILSATDLLRRVAEAESGVGKRPRASDYMSSGVQAVAPDAPLLLAARMMCLQHLHRLPVLDHENRPVGIISCMDVVAALVNAMDEMKMAEP